MARHLIFTVNPGATSTKCALYALQPSTLDPVHKQTLEHPDRELAQFAGIAEQFDYRADQVAAFLQQGLGAGDRIIACAGRGGMLTPVPSGAIRVCPELVHFSLHTPVYAHASNLGAALAHRVAQQHGVDAYIVDPVSVDEFWPVARLSGSPEFERFSFVHALNTRATARQLAQRLGKPFERLNCVVAHLGAGFSIAALHRGRIVDNDNRMEGAAFTPERAGGVPPIPLIDACYSGRYSRAELKKKLYGEGGLYAYLGTRDLRQVEARIEQGDAYAQLIFDALVYQIGKSMAAMAAALDFQLDGLILTGGLAYSARLCARLQQKLAPIGTLYPYPGSNENRALAETTARVLTGLAPCLSWPVSAPAGDLHRNRDKAAIREAC